MKVLVVFGSKSDEKIYKKIIHGLKKNKIDHDLRICSAHKTPEDIDKILKSDAKLIISGAGLAAHLPGVIASKTIRPVIGVPCGVEYQGLDAFLSIAQMPPGIPVLSVGVNNSDVAVSETAKIIKNHSNIFLVGEKGNPALNKAEEILKEFSIGYKIAAGAANGALNIDFSDIRDEITKEDCLVIYCPTSKESSAETALNMLKRSQHGLWVGLNNGVNAALAAIEILSLDGKYDAKLRQYRKKLGDNVKQSNQEIN